MPQKLSRPIRRDLVIAKCLSEGWEYQDLARVARIDSKSVTNALAGKKLQIKTIKKLAAAIGTSCEQLIDDDSDLIRGNPLNLSFGTSVDSIALTQSGQVDLIVRTTATIRVSEYSPEYRDALKKLTDALLDAGFQLVSIESALRPHSTAGTTVFESSASFDENPQIYIGIIYGVRDNGRPYWACISGNVARLFYAINTCDRKTLPTETLAAHSDILESAEGTDPPKWLKERLKQLDRFPRDLANDSAATPVPNIAARLRLFLRTAVRFLLTLIGR